MKNKCNICNKTSAYQVINDGISFYYCNKHNKEYEKSKEPKLNKKIIFKNNIEDKNEI